MDSSDVDVQKIVDRIRDQLRRRLRANPTPDVWAIFTDSQLTADVSSLYSVSDPADVSFPSHRKFFGGLAAAMKRGLRRLLTPILWRQATYNAANARIASRVREHLATLFEHQRLMRDELLTAQREMREELLAAQQRAAEQIREELLAVLQERPRPQRG